MRAEKAVRSLLGLVFLGAGLFKFTLFGLAGFARFLAAAGIPWPYANAAFVATVETIGGLCLLAAPARIARAAAVVLLGDISVAILTVGIRVQMGNPVRVDGNVVAGEPWRFAFEVACWLGLAWLAVKSPSIANVENVETP